MCKKFIALLLCCAMWVLCNGATMEPRNVAGQVVRGSDLWGRSRETRELWHKLERGSVLLSAPRRYGKTSMMFALRDQPDPDWQVVYVNVEFVVEPAEFANEIVAALLAQRTGAALLERVRATPGALRRWFGGLFDEVGGGVPDIAEIKLRLREQAPPDWRSAVEPFWRLVSETAPRTLVILDEFPVMVTSFLERDEAEGLRFLHWFRALRQEGGRILLGGSVNIEPVLMELGQSALLNDLERIRLPAFSPAESAAFVAAVFRGEGQVVPEGLPSEIVALARTGVPFFLQVIIDELIGEARRRQVLPTEAIATEVLRDSVLGPRCVSRFSHYLERLRHYGPLEATARQVLHEAALHDVVSIGRVAELANDAKVSSPRLLTRLESDWYIERDGEYVRFADGFVREWWRRNAPMARAR